MIGENISHYKILEKLGEGGMGVVYRAHDTELYRIVAMKFLPQHIAAAEDERMRFLQEAKAAATLNHPNICIIYGIGEEAGQQFIVMEYVDGVTLREMISRSVKTGKPLRVESVVSYAAQIAEALLSAHERGIVHRDLKPENIMVDAKGSVKLMDFGLAKLKGVTGLTRDNETLGTTAYMSPEQIQGIEVDTRSDLWSLGVVLYELLAGLPPFRGEHHAAVMYGVLNADPESIKTVRPDVPSHVQTLLSRLLQKDPRKRPANASEVLELLRRTDAPAGPKAEEKSIAVLYFENFSPERESDYFCAGITDDIITDLSKIKGLKVTSRTDVLVFRNKEVNTREVGEALGVNYILEGSVRKAGNKIRITGQLIDVRTGFHVWADRFDRLLDDIFELQNEVSQRIAEALKVSLTETEKELLARRPTDDLRAYDFYLRGKEFVFRRGRKNNVLAIQMFENALSLDPKFSAAYGALGEAYAHMFAWYDGDSHWIERAVEASQKALETDPHSIEALCGTGIVYYQQRRYKESRNFLEDVVRQNPDYYDAHRFLGAIADIEGDYPRALGHYEACARIKPYSEEPWMHMYMTHLRKGDTEASDAAQRKLLEVGLRILEINPDNTIVLSRIAGPLAHAGRREEAFQALKKIRDLDPTDGLLYYNCACAYAVMGEKAEALTCLLRSLELGYKNTIDWLKADPDFASIRNEPEFQKILTQFP